MACDGNAGRWTVPLSALALWLALSSVPLSAQMLAAVPVEISAKATGAPAAGPLVRIFAQDAHGLAQMWGSEAVVKNGHSGHLDLELMLGTHPSPPEPNASALAATFVVDFNDTAVQQLRQQLLAEVGQRAVGGEDLVRFVAKSMRADYASQASYASKVARALQGDCTEYSLLTAALARSLQIPARIVHGLALVYIDQRWLAYGHAWVQTFESGRWVLRDSALADTSALVYYVPAYLFSDEGPGYKLGLLQNVGRMPSRIQILDPGRAASLPKRD